MIVGLDSITEIQADMRIAAKKNDERMQATNAAGCLLDKPILNKCFHRCKIQNLSRIQFLFQQRFLFQFRATDVACAVAVAL